MSSARINLFYDKLVEEESKLNRIRITSLTEPEMSVGARSVDLCVEIRENHHRKHLFTYPGYIVRGAEV